MWKIQKRRSWHGAFTENIRPLSLIYQWTGPNRSGKSLSVSKCWLGCEDPALKPSTPIKIEVWFVPCDWDKITGLRHAGTMEKEKLADDRLLAFWLYCDPESEHEYERQLGLYLGAVPSARADDFRKIIGAIAKEALSSSREIVVDEEPHPKWRIIWARTLLTVEQLNQEDRDVVFNPIDNFWQRFLDSDLPKLKSVIAALFMHQSTRISR